MFIIYIYENAFMVLMNKSNKKLFKEKMVSYIMGRPVQWNKPKKKKCRLAQKPNGECLLNVNHLNKYFCQINYVHKSHIPAPTLLDSTYINTRLPSRWLAIKENLLSIFHKKKTRYGNPCSLPNRINMHAVSKTRNWACNIWSLKHYAILMENFGIYVKQVW